MVAIPTLAFPAPYRPTPRTMLLKAVCPSVRPSVRLSRRYSAETAYKHIIKVFSPSDNSDNHIILVFFVPNGIVIFWRCNGDIKQEAQLSQTDRAMFRVTEYFARSFKVIRNETVEKGKSLLVCRCNCVCVLYRF